MGMMNFIFSLPVRAKTIFKNEKTWRQKTLLFYYFLKTSFKYLILVQLLKVPLKTEKIFGSSIMFYNYEVFYGLFNEIFISQEYAFCTDSSKPFIIDCGSNIGMSIVFFKRMYPDARIICFEPHEETFRLLQNNIRVNNITDVDLRREAVFNENQLISFYSDSDGKSVTGMSVTKRLLEKNRKLKEEQVQAVLLSDYITKPVDMTQLLSLLRVWLYRSGQVK